MVWNMWIGQALCNIKNEARATGGCVDILYCPCSWKKATYLGAFPEERRPWAFLGFYTEGGIEAIGALHDGVDVDSGDEEAHGMSEDVTDIKVEPLRYGEPMLRINRRFCKLLADKSFRGKTRVLKQMYNFEG